MHKHPCIGCGETFVCKDPVNCWNNDSPTVCDDCYLKRNGKYWIVGIAVGLVVLGLALWIAKN
ncbi:MAG TPA: hypothetical protein PKY82_34685 [Pyrinomonadaceae bacterium]|nr:hypothetical protein [Pyrinomonadaceae bacterium]